jgi:uncharacterized protein
MELTKKFIVNTISERKSQITDLGVKTVGLFGSYCRNTQTEESDIDLLVDFRPDAYNYDNFINLCFLLDDLFIDKKVEVVTVMSLSPHIGPKILKTVEYVF